MHVGGCDSGSAAKATGIFRIGRMHWKMYTSRYYCMEQASQEGFRRYFFYALKALKVTIDDSGLYEVDISGLFLVTCVVLVLIAMLTASDSFIRMIRRTDEAEGSMYVLASALRAMLDTLPLDSQALILGAGGRAGRSA